MGNESLAITEALDAATQELTELRAQMASLQQRAVTLKRFIASGQRLMGIAESQSPTTHFSRHGGPTSADYIRWVFQEYERSMSLSELTDILRTREQVHGKWARTVIRNSLSRRPEFQRVGRGIYRLNTHLISTTHPM